nr:MotA/TolQ/ExbB proton channel family protein [uncultured Butyricicoccus sp.]
MNITFLIGLIGGLALIVNGILSGGDLADFIDIPSVMITVGGTIMTVISNYPPSILKQIPKHIMIMMNTRKFAPMEYIDKLVELAQVARKNGLLALESEIEQIDDPFFKQSITMIVDSNDSDKVREILENDLDCLSARHQTVSSMYERGAAIAPAFGMIGTLVGLVNMLKGMNLEEGVGNLGDSMATALITTFYGCIMAHMIFSPIANHLHLRDDEEILCKSLIIEGVLAIQSGENPKFLKEKLVSFLAQKQREMGVDEEGGGGKKAKGGKKGKKGKDE